MACGERDVGDYDGTVLTFTVNNPVGGDMQFDASQSLFYILTMEAYTELDPVLLATDDDHDGIISLTDISAGNYKFFIYGGTETNQIYLVVSSCTSYDPTNAPSGSTSPAPTDHPTSFPSIAPISHSPDPSVDPSQAPTSSSSHPTTDPSVTVSSSWIEVSYRSTEHVSVEDDVSSRTQTVNTWRIVEVVIGSIVIALLLFVIVRVNQNKVKRLQDNINALNLANDNRNLDLGNDNQTIIQNQANVHDVVLDKERKIIHSELVTSEGSSYMDHNMILVDDTTLEKDKNESEQPGAENADNFDEMFVEAGEKSVSKSDQNEAVTEKTTEGGEIQKDKVSFHGTKGDYYDEYNHRIYKERITNHGP
eukprot:817830_1